ncbi:MAG TPA: DNA polymerase, partial [Myxococcota bacterium]|nr:DNA polymerase [Myxococcota bacterium]
LKVLTRYRIGPFKIGGDPMLASYLLSQDHDRHDLLSLAHKYLGLLPTAINPNLKAHIAWHLEKLLVKKLEQALLNSLYVSLELPLEEVLGRMEMRGVLIDVSKLKELDQELNARLSALEQQAFDLAGTKFNLASPKQVADILFNRLALPMVKKTKTGSSTDSMVLEKLAFSHPLAKVLLEHRMCAKLISTYVTTLPTLINKDTGRIHTNYNQFVTATGRLSSSDPNLQNIPIRTVEGRRCRDAFVAKPGFLIISLDYSQVELRLLAFASQDPVLLDSFAKDQDVHRRTASEIFDIRPEDVSKEQRNIAKTINFGLLYGMGAQRLAQSLNIPRAQAQSYLEKYFAKYSGIMRWKQEVLDLAKKKGEVRTFFGRLRKLPELMSQNAMERARGERLAINTPIQGTAADIIKKAMIDGERFLNENYPLS